MPNIYKKHSIDRIDKYLWNICNGLQNPILYITMPKQAPELAYKLACRGKNLELPTLGNKKNFLNGQWRIRTPNQSNINTIQVATFTDYQHTHKSVHGKLNQAFINSHKNLKKNLCALISKKYLPTQIGRNY